MAQANADMKGVAKQIAQEFPKSNKRLERERRAAQEQLPRRRPDLHALAAARRGRVRAADRVRERRQPAARARHDAPARDGGARVARRLARTPVRAVAHRERRARRGRRPARPRARSPARWTAMLALMPPNTLPSEADVTAERAGAALHAGGVGAVGRAVRLRAGLAGQADQPERRAEGNGPLDDRRRPPLDAAHVRRHRVRARADAARRRRTRDLQPRQARQRRSRLPAPMRLLTLSLPVPRRPA